jgi:N-acylneuraminate cytidylyltransferase
MNIAIMPLRKGSKSIKFKNRKKILGRPLFSWALYEAAKSNLDKIYIFTDDQFIIDYVNAEYSWIDKIEVMNRSSNSATDIATTESAIEEFLTKINFKYKTISLLQATSPLITYEDINKCLDPVDKGIYDSVLTVVPFKRFLWSSDMKPVNYDVLNRPRRQDFNGDYIENGACYTITKEQWEKSHNRLGGKIGIVEMAEDSAYEVDEASDFIIIEDLLKKRLRMNKTNYIDIKIVVYDIDGVFTDASAGYTKEGESFKVFSMQDGMGLELLRNSGFKVIIITSEDSKIVKSRMDKLKISDIFMGVKDKYATLDNYISSHNETWSSIAYIGDDVNDITNINSSGLSFSPSNAVLDVKRDSDFVLNSEGGKGAVRESAEILIKFKNRQLKF